MFTQRLSMDCTREQYEKYLKDELLKMGYEDKFVNSWNCGVYQYISNNYMGINGGLGAVYKQDLNKYNRTYLGSFNPELFLSLAAMTDSERIFGYGEWAKRKRGNDFQFPQVGENCNPYWRKATKKEIMAKFGNEEPIWESCSNIINNLEEVYTAIKLLKSNGYKIMRKTETWEEV